MGRSAALIELSEKERGELEGLSRRRRHGQTAQKILSISDGSPVGIARTAPVH